MESDVECRLKALEEACRRTGARMTHQRREVLRVVVETDAHPDAHTVLKRVRKRMPAISFDTVYRTLSFLEEHGLINRVHASGERARFDGNDRPHHHFICTSCGVIRDQRLTFIRKTSEQNELGQIDCCCKFWGKR